MKANHELLLKLAELGILKSMSDFLKEPLKPGRLRTRFMEIQFIVDLELQKIYKQDPNVYQDNKEELSLYLEKFGQILTNNKRKTPEDLHVASVVCFCLSFLETSKTVYNKKLYTYLNDIIDYYERQNNVMYKDFRQGQSFYEKWEKIGGKLGHE
ncbi:MAG: hypothetical protein ACTSUT_02930 [Promethearchaeota archaeon]